MPLGRALGAIGVAALIAGCGGGGTSADTQPGQGSAPLTKAEYIAQSDEICADTEETVAELQTDLASANDSNSREQQAAVLQGAVSKLTPYVDRLNALQPPAEDEATTSEIEAVREQQLANFSRAADALQKNDLAQVKRVFREINELTGRVNELEVGYGFEVCGRT